MTNRDLQTFSTPERHDVVPNSVAELLSMADVRFVRAAYLAILGRPADPQGQANYLRQLRAGSSKSVIVRELALSEEGLRSQRPLAGLKELVAAGNHRSRWPAWLVSRVDRVVERLTRRREVLARLNAVENRVGDQHMQVMSALDQIQTSIARTEFRLAQAMERLQTTDRKPPARPHPVAGPAEAEVAGSARGGWPMILELFYSRTASPHDAGRSDDTRQLALGMRSLTVWDIDSGQPLFEVDFREGGNAAECVLFGFSQIESWGTWTLGRRSALALWLPSLPTRGLRLELNAGVFEHGFASVDVAFRSNVGHAGEATFRSGHDHTDVLLEAPRDHSPQGLLGSVRREADPLNVSESASEPVVSVVILNYNKPVLSALSAMATASSGIGVPYEILVVDNGSEPANWETLQRMQIPARRVRIDVNRYFGEGNNIGAEEARGRYLLFLNNDAFPAPGCVDELLAAFEQAADCGAACPIFTYPDGSIQEAGAFLREDGTAFQRGKHDAGFDPSTLPRFDEVDYGSAACLLIGAPTFRALGGFNYRFDPAYYEDTDLCFRLRLLGRRVWLARDARCAHIENATTSDKKHNAGSSNVVESNRRVFLSVWEPFLRSRDDADLPADILPAAVSPAALAAQTPTQATYSPFPLVPGGGERYLLASALALSHFGPTRFSTTDRYSHARLDNVLTDLGLPTGRLDLGPWSETWGRHLDRLVVMGNEALPRVAPLARQSYFHCQFPFPWRDASAEQVARSKAWLRGYRRVIVNSEFTRKAYLLAVAAHGIEPEVLVVHPPVGTQRLLQPPATRKRQILSIGRFTEDGHGKRQDVLIQAFKATSAAFRRDWKLVLCGSIPNNAAAKAHFDRLRASVGRDASVEFVISPSRPMLDRLLLESAVYAHATGYGVTDAADHWKCEHFGITIVEALAAGCQTYCYEVGGGPEIFGLGGAGATFGTVEELTTLFERSGTEGLETSQREKIAALFGDDAFERRMIAALR